jgi:tetratricopeptide (TPR) repeat protein
VKSYLFEGFNMNMKKLFLLGIVVAACLTAVAQTVIVKDTVMTTYPFGDPNPIPQVKRNCYPYCNFDEFSTTPEKHSWKIVVLENPYLRVKIFPEIGGKVWSVFDKTAGKEMFYDNNVVKFRDIAMRGPWTSGGIEFNYGVIGHAPSCAHPVDWRTEVKKDGSVSCFIGVLEMTSHSRWCVEINLPKDAVWLRTTSTWYNLTGCYQPYYSWTNSGVASANDLVLVFPGSHAIGHEGEYLSYPLDGRGRDISYYANQDGLPAISYHVVGTRKPFFGAYYEKSDWGMLHYAMRDEKLGRKYFAWSRNDDGQIWVDMLTDCGIQYVEMQGGRLYNQNMERSSLESSFRQPLFAPFGTDEWTEYWLPYSGIGVADEVSLDAVTDVKNDEKGTHVGIYPLQAASGTLTILGGEGKTLYTSKHNLRPAQPVWVDVEGMPSKVLIEGKVLWRAEKDISERPLNRNPKFNGSTASAWLLMARDYLGLRRYDKAEQAIAKALEQDSAYVDALALKAHFHLLRMQNKEAWNLACQALTIDQYNPEAGYVAGMAAVALGKDEEALDCFEVAAISHSALRSACHTELARLHSRLGNSRLAAEYARKALVSNAHNVTALMILYKQTGEGMEQILALDPLSHFADAEKMLTGTLSAEEFAKSFSEEIPWEEYLELAVFYHSIHLDSEAVDILAALPNQNALTALWMAWLRDDTNAIEVAEKQALDFVFPFRTESVAPLEWALAYGGHWQSRYLLALLKDYLGDGDAARFLVSADDATYAPYYIYRYQAFSGDMADVRKAIEIDPEAWRYRRILAMSLISNGKAEEAIEMLQAFRSNCSDNVQIGDALVDAYVAAGRYEEADALLSSLVILPFEGMRGSHDKYRDIKLHLAASAIDSGDYRKASRLIKEAQEWPRNLGVGKPAEGSIDHDVEGQLTAEIKRRRHSKGPFEPILPKMKSLISHDVRLFN